MSWSCWALPLIGLKTRRAGLRVPHERDAFCGEDRWGSRPGRRFRPTEEGQRRQVNPEEAAPRRWRRQALRVGVAAWRGARRFRAQAPTRGAALLAKRV